jgi:molybdopterin-guanine dinucleotide biosynthesis protein B
MASLFGAACREYRARPAYRVDGKWITYTDCGARVSRIAASLRDRLVRYRQATGKQPTIALLLPNSYHVLEFFFTAAVTHSILFPLNHRLSAAEIEAGLRASGAMILLTSDAFAETLAEIHWDTLSVQTIIWTSAPVDLPIEKRRSWDSLLVEAAPPAREPYLPTPSSYLQGFGTSGTTGRTKTVLHSHHNVYVHSFATIQALELSADDDHCWGHFGPMFHVGDAAFVWIALLLGARHIFHENQLHFEEIGKLLADEHVTIVKLVPSMLQLMCESGSIKALKFPDLRWILTGGAAPDPALVHRVATLFDCDLIQGFGMTEATCHVAFKVETQAPMKEGLRVSVIKHAHHSFDVDVPGKDSWVHRQSGAAEVLVSSGKRWALIHELRGAPEPRLPELLRKMSQVDLVVVEGFKSEPHRKIEVHRKANGKAPLFPDDPAIAGIATDGTVETTLPVAHLDDIPAVAAMMQRFAISVEDVLAASVSKA